MPKFLAEEGNVAPLQSGTFDFSGATFMVPTGDSLADVESRNLGSLVVMEYRIQYIPSSGTLAIASNTVFDHMVMTTVGPS